MLPSKLLFILPMTYGGTEKYRELVRRKLESSGFRYRIYDSFIPDREISMLRKASDIMIQVQITDQLSGSMLEHLYAENIIITGNWLPYAILDESGVFMHKVLSVDEVGEELLYILNDFNLFEERCKANPEIVQSFLDLENNMKSWIDMYEELGFEESSRVRGS